MLPKEDYFSQALYTFDIGQNDLTAGYKLNMTIEQVKAYVPDVLGQFSNVIKVQLFFFLFIFGFTTFNGIKSSQYKALQFYRI